MISVLNVSPAPGEVPQGSPLTFDVRTPTASPFVRVLVTIVYAGAQLHEVAYAGDPATDSTFAPAFTSSTVQPVTDAGYHRYSFTLVRTLSGARAWPDNPALVVYAFNTAGEEL